MIQASSGLRRSERGLVPVVPSAWAGSPPWPHLPRLYATIRRQWYSLFLSPLLVWNSCALQSSHTGDTALQLYTSRCMEWRKTKQHQLHNLENNLVTWLTADTVFSILSLFCKLSYLFPIHSIKTSVLFCVTVLHALCSLLPLLSSILNHLCFVHNSMWLSLIPGSYVPVWVSLTVSKRKMHAWLLSGEIFAMLMRAHFLILATSSGLVAIMGYAPPTESLFDWWSEQLICSSVSVYAGYFQQQGWI